MSGLSYTLSQLKWYHWPFIIAGGIICFLIGVGLNAPPSEKARFALEDEVRSDLKDPASAQFSNEHAYEWSRGHYSLCGYVNAKNSFGAYSGTERFVAAGQAVLIENEDAAQGGIFDALWNKSCRDGS